MDIKHFHRAESLEEAYQLLTENPKNIIIGGGIWLKMSKPSVDTLIDLSELNLDQVIDRGDFIEIGAMVTLRDYEIHESIRAFGDGFLSQGISKIYGVGFRNVATVGGTVAGRYPFSDLITPLLSLKAKLIFYPKLEMTLEEYLNTKTKMNHILTHIIIEKEKGKGYFYKVARTSTEFATLNVAVFNNFNEIRIVVGSRPAGPVLLHEAMEYLNKQKEVTDEVLDKTVQLMLDNTKFGSNYQASIQYRQQLAQTYVKRGIKEVLTK